MNSEREVVIVTGGGQSIGEAIALRSARDGYNVVVADINAETAVETAKKVNELGVESLAIKTDVTKSTEIKNLIFSTIERFDRVDYLVNNAGIVAGGPFWKIDESEWDRIFNVNIKGVFLCSKEAAKEMMKKKKGKIVNIASAAGKSGRPYLSHYSAAKSAVLGFTMSAALELAPYNIKVNAVCPGTVDTKFWNDLNIQVGKYFNLTEGQTLVEKFTPLIPLGRPVKPEDVAGIVSFLLSKDSDFMTGQSVNITGGREIHM